MPGCSRGDRIVAVSPGSFYVTTAIPYVNAAPHLGHALELVQADVLARHRRLRGQRVRFLTGTDDNAFKNVTAARRAGVDVQTFVGANADRFLDLRKTLRLSFDDFIRTSSDERHAPGVSLLWQQTAAHGDFYRKTYKGLYCHGCEQFYALAEAPSGCCPEHQTPLEPVTESNWFFRLSAYTEPLMVALESGRVRIAPANRRNEVLAFVRRGLQDISVSRPQARSNGWGVPVPGDPDQVVYVWWDALANYVTALGYATEHPDYQRWWLQSEERVHIIGKGIVRFHAVYWLALLLSTGQPLPTSIFVHEYLTLHGAKVAKSAGNAIDPTDLVGRYGNDAVRWWLLADVGRTDDTDFTEDRLLLRYNQDLANSLGNLVNRTVNLVHRYRGGILPNQVSGDETTQPLEDATTALPSAIDQALADFDFRGATAALLDVVDLANRIVSRERPWELAKAEALDDTAAGRQLDNILTALITSSRTVAHELQPFTPDGSSRLRDQLGETAALPEPRPVFTRLNR